MKAFSSKNSEHGLIFFQKETTWKSLSSLMASVHLKGVGERRSLLIICQSWRCQAPKQAAAALLTKLLLMNEAVHCVFNMEI
jgi:hypothetical protein